LLNSDAAVYGGSNMGNCGGVTAADKTCHNQPCSAEFILPPLSILVFRPERAADKVLAKAEAAPEKTQETLRDANRSSSVVGAGVPPPPHPNPLPEGEGTAQVRARQADDARFTDRRSTILLLTEGGGTAKAGL
jgi:hypothetical protein